MRGATPFVRWGNLAALALCVFAIGIAWLSRKPPGK
jgi:hypothetical protein